MANNIIFYATSAVSPFKKTTLSSIQSNYFPRNNIQIKLATDNQSWELPQVQKRFVSSYFKSG